MHGALIALALAASPAWGRLSLSAGAGLSQYDGNTGTRYGASAGQELFAGGLANDSEPMAFQALVQQVPILAASGYYDHDSADAFESREVGGSVSGTAYLDKVAGFSATGSVEQLHEQFGAETVDFLRPELFLAVGGATPRQRLWLGFDFSELYVNGQATSDSVGHLSLSGGMLFEDLVWLGAELNTIRDGERGAIDVEVAPTHRTDFDVSGYGERGRIYIDTARRFARYGGSASAGLWLTDEVRLGLAYGISSAQQDFGGGNFGDAIVEQGVSVSFGLRLE